MRNVVPMMTSSNGTIFRVAGPLCGEFTSLIKHARNLVLCSVMAVYHYQSLWILVIHRHAHASHLLVFCNGLRFTNAVTVKDIGVNVTDLCQATTKWERCVWWVDFTLHVALVVEVKSHIWPPALGDKLIKSILKVNDNNLNFCHGRSWRIYTKKTYVYDYWQTILIMTDTS